MSTTDSIVGFGDPDFKLAVCIGNKPESGLCESLSNISPLEAGQLTAIVQETGNHWRKIFNIYAKIMFELEAQETSSWQQYRDNKLLQKSSGHALIFSNPNDLPLESQSLIMISGKTHAEESGLLSGLTEHKFGFFYHLEKRIIVTPYFDYRQLSNAKIETLVAFIKEKLKQ